MNKAETGEERPRPSFEEKLRPSYYAIIPAHVRYDDTLPPNAKLLYGEITALCSVEGICWASNRYFAELYGVKIRAVQNWVDALRSAGHILVDPIDGYKRHIRLPEAERAARVSKGGHAEKDTHAEKDMPHAEKDMGGMQKKTRRGVLKDTHSITLNSTMSNTKSIAPSGASELSASLFQDGQDQEKDILSSLAPAELAALEASARARVIAENGDPVRRLAREGKAWTSVKPMMRKLLTEKGTEN